VRHSPASRLTLRGDRITRLPKSISILSQTLLLAKSTCAIPHRINQLPTSIRRAEQYWNRP
jgi:hypothetical protein